MRNAKMHFYNVSIIHSYQCLNLRKWFLYLVVAFFFLLLMSASVSSHRESRVVYFFFVGCASANSPVKSGTAAMNRIREKQSIGNLTRFFFVCFERARKQSSERAHGKNYELPESWPWNIPVVLPKPKWCGWCWWCCWDCCCCCCCWACCWACIFCCFVCGGHM